MNTSIPKGKKRKRNINDILKKGAKTKIKIIDYGSPAQIKKLKKLKEESDRVLKNKEVNPDNLARIFINK